MLIENLFNKNIEKIIIKPKKHVLEFLVVFLHKLNTKI